MLTPLSCASAAAFTWAASEKSIDTTSRPCSASQTPLRPSPSATASSLPADGSSGLHEARK
jgi:hypothetical protein